MKIGRSNELPRTYFRMKTEDHHPLEGGGPGTQHGLNPRIPIPDQIADKLHGNDGLGLNREEDKLIHNILF
jgi:hypothetical protein